MGGKGLSALEFRALVREFSPPIDPLRYAGSVDPGRILLISGRYDYIVHPKDTRLLWEHMGRPTWIKVPSGHYSYALFFLWGANRAVEHLDNVLNGNGANSPTPRGEPLPPPGPIPLMIK